MPTVALRCLLLVFMTLAAAARGQDVQLRILGMKRVWQFDDAVSARAVGVAGEARRTPILAVSSLPWMTRSDATCREVGISPKQKKAIADAILKAQLEARKTYREQAKNKDVFGRRAIVQAANVKRKAAELAAVNKTLTPTQVTRLKQLQRQAVILHHGTYGLTKDSFLPLMLTPGQVEQLRVTRKSPHAGKVIAGTLYDKSNTRAIMALREELVRVETSIIESTLDEKQRAALKRLSTPRFSSLANNTAIGVKNDAEANKELALKFFIFSISRDGTGGWGFGQKPVTGNGSQGSGLPMKRVELLSLEPVWKVVGLDADQKGAILRLRERYQQRGMKAFERSAALGPDEMAKMIAQWETTDRESLDKILSSQQRNRLEQIRAQVILRNDGPSGLQDDAFESLKITEAQHKQMAERLKEGRKPLVERFRNQTWAGAMGRINEVLDVKQRALLRKLLGKLVVRPMVT